MGSNSIKKLAWQGNTRAILTSYPKTIRQIVGTELLGIQFGEEPNDWKPMTTVGAGVKEIRIKQEKQYRVFYVAKFEEAVYVLHIFIKKSQKTPQKEIELAKQRYKELVNSRSVKNES